MNRRWYKTLQNGQEGFSLIELLVAVAILSIAAVALLESQTQAINVAGNLEKRSLASIVAENRLTLALGHVEQPVPGARSGSEQQMGVDFLWTETVRPAPGNDLMVIEVVVTPPSNRTQELARLVGFRKVL